MAPALPSDGVTDRSFFQCLTLLLASGIGSGVLVSLGSNLEVCTRCSTVLEDVEVRYGKRCPAQGVFEL